jgi:putative heme-binding domain-containing protein
MLAGTRPGTAWLLKLKEHGEMPKDLDAMAGRLLRNSPFQGERNKALLLFPAPGKLDPKKLPPITELAKRSGNADKGKQLIAASLKGETQCLKCHTIRGIGGNIGPDLSMIGKKASKENLFESILLPSKAIADQYLQWTIENGAGQKITGLLVEETPTHVTIRDANGKDTKIAKDDIEKRTKSLVSIMPEDIVKGFSEDDLIDVVAYLFTLKTASLTPESWHILGPFPNDASDSGLDAVWEPEKKTDLAAAYKGKNGASVKWTTVKQNGSGYVDLKAHYDPTSALIASYVYQTIESPADQEVTILLGNDDGAKVWVNGEKVFENRDHFAATPERNKFTAKFKKGTNAVLMKIVNGDGPHGFYLSFTSEQELKVVK